MSARPSEGTPSAGPHTVTVSFDGSMMPAISGQSIGAALACNGITAWRSTRKDQRPRGLFCGIGVCFDCLVTVDGEANRRACLVEVQEGMKIEGTCVPAQSHFSGLEGSRQ